MLVLKEWTSDWGSVELDSIPEGMMSELTDALRSHHALKTLFMETDH